MNDPIPNLRDLSPELLELVEKYCQQTLDTSENRRLNALLLEDVRAQDFFLAYTGMHAQLLWDYGPQPKSEPARPIVRPSGAEPVSRWAAGRGWRWAWPRWAAAVVVVMTLGAFLVFRPTTPPTGQPALAIVTRSLGAQGGATALTLEPGQRLGPGRLVLAAGAIEITFQNGVTILLEGPGALELQADMRAFLSAGRAVVNVPKNATGFVLDTPQVRVLDLGTEFGVKTGQGGSTDIQVYQGSVITTPRSPDNATNSPQRVVAGSAVRIDLSSSPETKPIQYSPQRFVRQLPDPRRRGGDFALPYNQSRLEQAQIFPAPAEVVIDGDLSDWNRAGAFQARCDPPYGEDYHLEGMMMYDAECLYLGAHVADPAPMRSVINPATDGELGWVGGGLQVRLSTDRALRWPVDADTPEHQGGPDRTRPQDLNERLAHLTLWHFAPLNQDCLHLCYGMDFHGGRANPTGYRGVFHRDPDGRGYTLEYAIPWSLLNAAADTPRAGDTLAVNWVVHWSDESGRLWRGQLVEIRNPRAAVRTHTWEKASTWGQALFR